MNPEEPESLFPTQAAALIQAASGLILRLGELGRHHIACALLTSEGDEVLGLHVSTNLGPASICAEAAAISEALKRGSRDIDMIVAVRHCFDGLNSTEVVPPCGRCRELILEYGRSAKVLVQARSGIEAVPITDLLPAPFRRRRGASGQSDSQDQ